MFRIREATRDDGKALLRLEAQSPQGTGISIVADREDFFYRAGLHEGSTVLIAEEDERLVARHGVRDQGGPHRGQAAARRLLYDLRGERPIAAA